MHAHRGRKRLCPGAAVRNRTRTAGASASRTARDIVSLLKTVHRTVFRARRTRMRHGQLAWNDGKPKYDIREWAPNHEQMGKGVTLTPAEIQTLLDALEELDI